MPATEVSINVSGAAETFMDGPFPHAQHFHIGAQGVCPGPDADGDGVVSTPEGQPFYGMIGASLTTEGDTSTDSALAVERFPGGSAYTYERTFEVNAEAAAAIKNGTASVVVHGVDPTLLPAACGTLASTQRDAMPEDGADTGVEDVVESGITAGFLAAGAAAMMATGAGALALRRRGAGAR